MRSKIYIYANCAVGIIVAFCLSIYLKVSNTDKQAALRPIKGSNSSDGAETKNVSVSDWQKDEETFNAERKRYVSDLVDSHLIQ